MNKVAYGSALGDKTVLNTESVFTSALKVYVKNISIFERGALCDEDLSVIHQMLIIQTSPVVLNFIPCLFLSLYCRSVSRGLVSKSKSRVLISEHCVLVFHSNIWVACKNRYGLCDGIQCYDGFLGQQSMVHEPDIAIISTIPMSFFHMVLRYQYLHKI